MWTRIIDGISARLAFFPPTPPSYTLDSTGPNLSVKPVQSHLKQVPSAKVHRLPIRGARNEFIVAAFVPSPGDGTAVRFTLLHSHGNAVDLGQMLPLYEQMARLLKVNILTYDYRGYGMSTGSPAASATFQDINTAFRCLLDIYNLKARDIVLYGQSLGSGPTSWLASKTPGIAGVVLHSPFLSGLRVLKPSWKSWPAWADIFPNFKYAPKIESKTIIIHVSSLSIFQPQTLILLKFRK